MIAVRSAGAADIAGLAITLAPDISPQQLEDRWQGHLAGHGKMLVVELVGHAVATVSMEGDPFHRSDSLRLFALAVGPAYRRRGVAAALIEAVEDEARLIGLNSVHLEVAVENVNATRLYERLGYQRLNPLYIDTWTRVLSDGSEQQIEDLSCVMVKRFDE